MPKPLLELLEAELKAGNRIVEVFHSHPAPPAGACFRLARKVTTRPRKTGRGLLFHEVNSSLYAGEFTDSRGFHFIIEPPGPPPPEPDMDAIRAAHAPRPPGNRRKGGRKGATPGAASMDNLYPDPLPGYVPEIYPDWWK